MKRSRDFWFDDGNIVIVACNTAYRLHRGVLARYSSVFNDLFMVPQPPPGAESSNESIAGCPVVRISDASDDFKILLQALYEGSSLFPRRAPMACSAAVALLELSHKYNIKHFRDEVTQRMKTCFTTSFSEWKQLSFSCKRRQVLSRTENFLSHLSSLTLDVVVERDAIRAANVMRLLDDNTMLPVALFLCAQLTPATLLAGIKRPDGIVDKLSGDDLARCLAAQTTLVMKQLLRPRRPLQWDLFDRCGSTSRCTTTLAELSDTYSRLGQGPLTFIPLAIDLHWRAIFSGAAPASLCFFCEISVVIRDLGELEHLWGKLPSDLGLKVENWNAAKHPRRLTSARSAT